MAGDLPAQPPARPVVAILSWHIFGVLINGILITMTALPLGIFLTQSILH
jgi:hypothetical protein